MCPIYNPITPITGGVSKYGDGSDGDVIIAVDTTLSRDMFYNNLTINPFIYLNTHSFRICVKNKLINNGIIRNNGLNGLPGGALNGGVAPIPFTGGSLRCGGLAGNGGAINTDGAPNPTQYMFILGNGGSGGNSDVKIGGIGTAGGNIANDLPSPFSLITAFGFPVPVISVGSKYCSGRGGGGGAGDFAAGGGGSGGTGGQIILICARELLNYGLIEANGGIGGDGFATATTGVGGGGGGCGGLIILIYNQFSLGIIAVNAGVGGSGFGTGTNGLAGDPGKVINLKDIY